MSNEQRTRPRTCRRSTSATTGSRRRTRPTPPSASPAPATAAPPPRDAPRAGRDARARHRGHRVGQPGRRPRDRRRRTARRPSSPARTRGGRRTHGRARLTRPSSRQRGGSAPPWCGILPVLVCEVRHRRNKRAAAEVGADGQRRPVRPTDPLRKHADDCRRARHRVRRPPRAPPASTPSAPTGPTRPAWALFALAVGGFAIGTTEFASMGLLPQIAAGVGVTHPDRRPPDLRVRARRRRRCAR